MLLAASAALVSIPGLAMASPGVDFSGSTHFTVSGGTFLVETPHTTMHCESISGTGEYTTGSTGTIQLTYHGCTIKVLNFELPCTTEGQSTGTITTTVLPFHEQKDSNGPVMLLTTNGGHSESYKCAGQSVVIGGNGVIGAVTAPGYNEASNTFTLNFAEAEGGGQAITTTEETGEIEWELTSSVNGGEVEPITTVGEATATFSEGGEGTTTE
ncbi:MAG TPA: hypothetical protein VFG58_07520 [Solirubrobacterales bacterium]|nr:hypothetical protein [Solirubrobacterales bacterium]